LGSNRKKLHPRINHNRYKKEAAQKFFTFGTASFTSNLELKIWPFRILLMV
jgi:hypothetical protein